MAFRGGRLAGRMTRSARWGGLRIEPYDPNARDADGDGIVQEGTAWERPAGTLVLDSAGREIAQGQESAFRPRGLRIVQRDTLFGRGYTDVPYTPTYEAGAEQEVSGTATALSEHGSRSLREQGIPSIRDIVTPPRPEPAAKTPEPVGAAAPETFTREEIDGFVEIMNDVLNVAEEVRVREPEVVDRAEVPYIVGVPGAKTRGDRPSLISNEHSDRFGPMIQENLVRGAGSTRDWANNIRAALEENPDDPELLELLDLVTTGKLDPVIGRGLQDVMEAYEDRDVLIAVRDGVLLEILQSGRVKSQHETGTSGGMRDAEKRVDVEEAQFGVPRDIDPKRRPIYGWVRSSSRKNGVEGQQDKIGSEIYGRINLRLKSKVKERTTLTLGDSIGESRSGVPMLGKQRRELVSEWFAALDPTWRERWASWHRTEDTEHGNWIGRAVGHFRNDELRSRIVARVRREHPELARFVEEVPDFDAPIHYTEAQIHGGVDVNDVEAIELPDGVEPEYRSQIEQMAEPLNIRVGTRRELDEGVPVEQVVEEVPEPEVVPETVEEVAERTEKVKANNKRILDRIKSIGGAWGRIDQKFKETIKRGPRVYGFATQTPDDLAALQREWVKQPLESISFIISNGRAPEGMSSSDFEFWMDQINSMDPDLRQHLAETDVEDLLDEIDGYAREYFSRLDKRVRVRVPLGRLGQMLKDGRYKTTHEVSSKHSAADARAQLETQFGLPLDAPADVRPASGFVLHQDSIQEAERRYKERTGNDVTEFTELDQFEGSLDSYGFIEIVLDDAVADRTLVTLGDSLNCGSFPVSLNSDDPNGISNAILRSANALSGHQTSRLLNFLRAGREGSLWKARTRSDWWRNTPEMDSRAFEHGEYMYYNEALIAGAFDVDEIAEVRVHSKATVLGEWIHREPQPMLGFENGLALMEALREEFFSRDALALAGLSEDEIDYLLENGLLDKIRPDTFDRYGDWPKKTKKRLDLLLRHRKAKEIDQMLRDAGIKNIKHLHESGLNPMDPASISGYEGRGETAEEVRIANIRKEIVEELREAAAKHKAPKADPDVDEMVRNMF